MFGTDKNEFNDKNFKEEKTRMYECGYCGKKWETVEERTKCEMECAKKAQELETKRLKEEKESKREARETYVKSLWDKAKKAIEEAEKAQAKFDKEYHNEYDGRYEEDLKDIFDSVNKIFWF